MNDLEYFLITVFNDSENKILGNVSAVFLLEKPLSENKLQRIANDLNQPATTFIWKTAEEWFIRWFAPDAEIPLCGHGTMAAIALFDHLEKKPPIFHYNKGSVTGVLGANGISTVLKAGSLKKSNPPEGLKQALGEEIIEYYTTSDKDLVLLENQKCVQEM